MPTALDTSVVTALATWAGHHRFATYVVESGVHHAVFGGLVFAIALFLLWIRAVEHKDSQTKVRVATILGATLLAVIFCLVASKIWTVMPPNRTPGIMNLYPTGLGENPNSNCFPSFSTALYAAVAAGVASLSRRTGIALAFAIVLLVALPRIFLGGHYPSDVLVGGLLGVLAYVLVRVVEPRLFPAWTNLLAREPAPPLANLIVFLWIAQVLLEFRDVVWLRNAAALLLK